MQEEETRAPVAMKEEEALAVMVAALEGTLEVRTEAQPVKGSRAVGPVGMVAAVVPAATVGRTSSDVFANLEHLLGAIDIPGGHVWWEYRS